MKELQSLMNDIQAWSDATFGELQRTPGIINHLKKEVSELSDAVELYQQNNTCVDAQTSNALLRSVFFEFADCFMLLLDAAKHMEISADVLMFFTRQKLEINKNRKWGKPDANGVVEHVKCENKAPIKHSYPYNLMLTKIAQMWGVPEADITNKADYHLAAEARFVYMFYLKNFLGASLTHIGYILGGYKHDSVIYGLKQVANRADVDKGFYQRLVELNLDQWLTKQPVFSTK